MAARVARSLLYGASVGFSRRLYSGGTSVLASLPCKRVFCGLKPAVPLSRHARLVSPKCLYSSSPDDGEEEAGEGKKETEDAERDDSESEDSESLEMLPPARHHALATIRVPDHFPDVPLLPISRSPIFPRLARMLEAGVSEHAYKPCAGTTRLMPSRVLSPGSSPLKWLMYANIRMLICAQHVILM